MAFQGNRPCAMRKPTRSDFQAIKPVGELDLLASGDARMPAIHAERGVPSTGRRSQVLQPSFLRWFQPFRVDAVTSPPLFPALRAGVAARYFKGWIDTPPCSAARCRQRMAPASRNKGLQLSAASPPAPASRFQPPPHRRGKTGAPRTSTPPNSQAHGYRDLTEECPGNEVRGCAAIAIEEISSEFENGWSDLCRNPLHLE